MAIPFVLPSNDEAEAQGQQLEQLMLDLYAALQQVLRSRNAQHPSRNQLNVYSTIVLCVVMWFVVTCMNRAFLSFAI